MKQAIAAIDEHLARHRLHHWRYAQVAETVYTTGKGKHARSVRLVVRRTRLADRAQRRCGLMHTTFITRSISHISHQSIDTPCDSPSIETPSTPPLHHQPQRMLAWPFAHTSHLTTTISDLQRVTHHPTTRIINLPRHRNHAAPAPALPTRCHSHLIRRFDPPLPSPLTSPTTTSAETNARTSFNTPPQRSSTRHSPPHLPPIRSIRWIEA